MIVERISYYTKQGHRRDLLNLLKAEQQRSPVPAPHGSRIYSRDVGSSGPVAVEFEFESYAEREKFWCDWRDARGAEFGKEFSQLVSRPVTRETWHLVE